MICIVYTCLWELYHWLLLLMWRRSDDFLLLHKYIQNITCFLYFLYIVHYTFLSLFETPFKIFFSLMTDLCSNNGCCLVFWQFYLQLIIIVTVTYITKILHASVSLDNQRCGKNDCWWVYQYLVFFIHFTGNVYSCISFWKKKKLLKLWKPW